MATKKRGTTGDDEKPKAGKGKAVASAEKPARIKRAATSGASARPRLRASHTSRPHAAPAGDDAEGRKKRPAKADAPAGRGARGGASAGEGRTRKAPGVVDLSEASFDDLPPESERLDRKVRGPSAVGEGRPRRAPRAGVGAAKGRPARSRGPAPGDLPDGGLPLKAGPGLPSREPSGPRRAGLRPPPASSKRQAGRRAATGPAPEASSQTRELAVALATEGIEKKALGIEILDVTGKLDYADFLVIMTGRSDRHVQAIATGIEEAMRRKKVVALSIEGLQHATWVLMDFGDVVVHVFQEEARRLYDIEGLWIDAGRVPVPSGAEPGPGFSSSEDRG